MTTRPVGAVLVCAVPALLAASLTLFWHQTGRLSIGGDEPHYLIIAASLGRDGDLDLGNNYRHEIFTGEIFGELEPHVVRTDAGWMPYHTPGLGALLAGPFAWGGRDASRLALCALPLLFGLACLAWLPLPRETALWVTAGTLGSMPVVFGASRIYPDLVGGMVAGGLALWLWSDDSRQRGPFAWGLFWFVLGVLPWLHVKFAGAVLVFAAAGLWQQWRAPEHRAVRTHLLMVAPAAIGGVSHAAFNLYAFGEVAGGRSSDELSADPFRGLELFLGLHFDQAQGMLFQHPLLVITGLVSLGILIRARHRLVLPWLAVYAALVVPNALQLARYGGGGPAGRFGWSALWLWLVPVGLVLGSHHRRLGRFVAPAVIASGLYQGALAYRWVPDPTLLFPVLSETLSERNSLFPGNLRALLPSFYFWDYRSYLIYLPNLLWVAAALSLVALGAVSRGARRG